MSIMKFLSHLRGLKVKVWLDGERLRVKAPNGVMNSELKAQLKEHKEELLRFLQSTQEKPKDADTTPKKQEILISHEQRTIWIYYRLRAHPPMGNVCVSLKLKGPKIDRKAMEASLRTISARHSLLRTSFPETFGKPTPVVADEVTIPLKGVNLRKYAPEERWDELDRRLVEECEHAFELSKGPLIRCTFFRMEDEERIITITMHRIIADKRSLYLFLDELELCYAAYSNGQEPRKL